MTPVAMGPPAVSAAGVVEVGGVVGQVGGAGVGLDGSGLGELGGGGSATDAGGHLAC